MIRAESISKSFGKNLVVDNLSFNVSGGEIAGFIGPNGAGKTTTIRRLTGIIRPDHGDISIAGTDMKRSPIKAKSDLGFVLDSPDMFLKMTGLEYVNFISDVYKVPQEVRQERIKKYSDKLSISLEALAGRMTGFSHGMRQKTMIIAALCHEPKVWILDEPMVGLDPQAAFSLKTLMREHADSGNAVLFSTHVLEVAEKICDKIIIINRGKLLYEGALEELEHKDGGLEEVFLEMTDKNES